MLISLFRSIFLEYDEDIKLLPVMQVDVDRINKKSALGGINRLWSIVCHYPSFTKQCYDNFHLLPNQNEYNIEHLREWNWQVKKRSYNDVGIMG